MAGLDDNVQIRVTLESSGVTQGAANVQTALQGIARSGVTSADSVRMGWAKVSPQFDQLNQKLQTVVRTFQSGSAGIGGFTSSLAGVSGSLIPLTLGIAALGLAFSGLRKAIGSAAEAEDTMRRLEGAVQRTADASKTATAEIEAAIQQLFKSTAFDDEPLRKAATSFVTITGNARQAAEAMKPIADLSVALGVDLDNAARMVAKAGEGMTTALQRAGIVFTDAEQKMLKTATAGDRLALIFDKINEKVGGAASAELGTFAGQVANFQKAWDELAEALGSKVLPMLTSIIELLGLIPGALSKATPAGGKKEESWFVRGLGNAVTGIKRDIAALTDQDLAEDILSDEQAFGAFGKTAGSTFTKGFHQGLNSGGVFGDTITDALATANAQMDALAKSNAFAKMAPQIESARQHIEGMGLALDAFRSDIQIKLKPPDLDPVAVAVQEVTTKINAITKQADDAIRQLTNDAKSQVATRTALQIDLGIAQQKGDLEAVVKLTEQLRQANARIGADLTLVKEYRAAKDEAKGLGETLKAIATDDALAQMAIKAQVEFAKLSREIEDIASKAKATIEGLNLPSGLADSLNAQIDKAKAHAQAQTTILAELFFDPEMRAQAQEAARDFQRAHTDGLTAGAKVLGDRLHKAAEELAAATDQFASEMADLFTAGVTGGAAGFADAASRLFLQGVNEGAKDIFKSLAAVAFGAAPERSQFIEGPLGDDLFVGAKKDAAEQQAKIMGVFSGAVAALGQTMNILQNAKKGQEVSVLGTTLSFAATGASIGALFTPLGAAIGAVVGALAGLTIALIANAKAQKAQPYAAYGIRDGEAYVEPFAGKEGNFANVTQGMMNEMLSQMQTTLESTRNDYVKLLMRFPEGVHKGLMEGITAANFAPTMATYEKVSKGMWTHVMHGLFGPGFWRAIGVAKDYKYVQQPGGDIGNPIYDKAAQKNFMQDFQNWVNNTLPKDIIATFEEPLARGFMSLGLTADKFHQIWERLQAIDPKDAIKSLNDLYDALTAFQNAEKFLSTDRLYGGAGFVFEGGLLGDAQVANLQSFADKLAQADFGLVQMGATIDNLIGPEQIAQAKSWGDALMQREQAVKEFFQQVAQAIDNVIQGYQASIRDLTLEGMKTPEGAPDINAQVNYLKQYADSLYGQIEKAPTIEIATQLSDELQKTILQIKQIGGAQSVEAAEAYRVWALTQLNAAQDLVVGRLQELAQDVADQNAAFLDAIQAFIDAFRQAAEDIAGIGAEVGAGTDTTTTTGGPPGVSGGGKYGGTDETGNPRDYNYDIVPPGIPPVEPPVSGGREHIPTGGYTVPRDEYVVPVPPPVPTAPEALYEPPKVVYEPPEAFYEPPEASQSRELMGMVVEGTRENVVYLRRIAENQERTLALLAEGRDIRVDVGGELDVTVNNEPTGAVVPLTDDGFDRRTYASKGRR